MYLNFVPNLFLEVIELTKFKESLDDFGFRKALLEDSISFGLVKSLASPGFPNGRVERDLDNGLNQKTIKIGAVAAINNEGKMITNPQVTGLVIPSDNTWHWVKIAHQYTTLESGKVTIDASGNLTGVGTVFTETLRGNPNFPSLISFPNSSGNTLEYEVLEVVDDTHAIIVHPSVSGGGTADFYAEGDLLYRIVGTFTDGVAVPDEDKYPFKYDSCNITLVNESVTNVRPSYTPGQEFFLARVKVTNGNLVIQDKRTEFWETKGSSKAIEIDREANPLIGVEAVKWQNEFNSGDRNIVEVAWGMRSTNWTVDSSQNIVTFLGSSAGGSFKTIADFTDGDFNGWRLYYNNGKYANIVNSIKQGSAINLYLDVLDVDNLSTDGGVTFTGTQLLVVPDCEEVELQFNADPTDSIFNVNDNDKFTFPVNTPVAECLVTVYKDPTCLYNARFRYKSFKEYSQWQPISSGSYFTEASFKSNGELKPSSDRVTHTYISNPTAAFIQLTISPNSFKKFKGVVYKGDIIGVNTITGFSPGQVITLEIGVDKRYQHITGSINLNDDVFFNLSRTGAVEGNEFRLHFDCDALNVGSRKIYILDNYSGGTLDVIKLIEQGDVYAMLNQDGGIVIDCVFDDTGKWIAYQNYDLGEPFEVKMFSGDATASFDSTGLGKVKGWFGHALMNGSNDTVDMEDRFVLGTNVAADIKVAGGTDQVILDIANVPPHDHKVWGKKAARNTTGGGFDVVQVYVNGPADLSPDNTVAAPTGKTGGDANGNTTPITIKPKNLKLAYVQKLY